MQILDRRFDVLSTRQLHDLIRLRIDVFVVEQTCAYAELDGRDLEPGTRHVWAEEAGAAVACLRVLDDGDARRIGRVCTRLDQRIAEQCGSQVPVCVEREQCSSSGRDARRLEGGGREGARPTSRRWRQRQEAFTRADSQEERSLP